MKTKTVSVDIDDALLREVDKELAKRFLPRKVLLSEELNSAMKKWLETQKLQEMGV